MIVVQVRIAHPKENEKDRCNKTPRSEPSWINICFVCFTHMRNPKVNKPFRWHGHNWHANIINEYNMILFSCKAFLLSMQDKDLNLPESELFSVNCVK